MWAQDDLPKKLLVISPFTQQIGDEKFLNEINKQLIQVASLKKDYHLIISSDFEVYKQLKNIKIHQIQIKITSQGILFHLHTELFDLIENKVLNKRDAKLIPKFELIHEIEKNTLNLFDKIN